MDRVLKMSPLFIKYVLDMHFSQQNKGWLTFLLTLQTEYADIEHAMQIIRTSST